LKFEVTPISRTLFQPEKESDMPTPKPPYPAAFRQQIVELVRAGRGVSELAREFGCNASSIHAWLNADGMQEGGTPIDQAKPLSAVERQELIELRRRFKQVQQERDILAKATAWFAAKSEKTSVTSTNS
jgi:transposase